MKFASLLSLLAAPLLASAFLAPAPKVSPYDKQSWPGPGCKAPTWMAEFSLQASKPYPFSWVLPYPSSYVQTTRARGVVSMVQSKALPFLAAPKKLDGSLVGDFGFDPMGISDQVSLLPSRSVD